MKRLGIILLFSLLLIGCRKFDIEPLPPKVEDIFSVKEAQVSDGQDIKFTLQVDGIYTLTLTDNTTEQVLMREKIIGKSGVNSLKMWTKSLQSKYLYLSLEDESGKQIGKTLLLIN
jgi:hypothetical protein